MGYRRFQIGCVFVEYDLLNSTTFKQNCNVEFSYKFDSPFNKRVKKRSDQYSIDVLTNY